MCTHFTLTINFSSYSADFSFKKGIDNIFSNQSRISGLLATYTPEKLYGAISCFFHLF